MKANKRSFKPTISGMEQRLVMNASPMIAPMITPMAIHGQIGAQAPIIAAATTNQAVVELQNTSNLNVSFQFRWNSSSSWQSYTLAPGNYRYFWINASSSLSPQVTFDQSVLPGWQAKTYSLSYFNYSGGGTPPVSAAKLYQFQNISGGVDLYSITTQAVTGFKNSSNLTVAFQFRWNSSSSYSNTVYLAPGQTYYFWNSPPNASGPQIQFDQSVLSGWQTKTYSLSYNLYVGSGQPPFSYARLYTFKNVPGGVDLYS